MLEEQEPVLVIRDRHALAENLGKTEAKLGIESRHDAIVVRPNDSSSARDRQRPQQNGKKGSTRLSHRWHRTLNGQACANTLDEPHALTLAESHLLHSPEKLCQK